MRMKLYRIVRLDDERYFGGFKWSGPNFPMFSSGGAFYKMPDTIKRHLKSLCSEFEYKKNFCDGTWVPVKFDRSKLKQYAVDVFYVKQSTKETMPATDFFTEAD